MMDSSWLSHSDFIAESAFSFRTFLYSFICYLQEYELKYHRRFKMPMGFKSFCYLLEFFIMAMSVFSDSDLDSFIACELNVLFEGKHGVGKTHIALDAFKRNNLSYAYFSGSTLDPWVDLVGVPRPRTRNGQTYLELIRPEIFVTQDIEAIFVDELNRSAKKVRNALMEMIQFKTINGHPLSKLKVVWAAINPPEDSEGGVVTEYDSDELDPALKDRFQIYIRMPYKPSPEYFSAKYGKPISDQAITWWNGLPPNIRNEVSPRRLDFALTMFNQNIDLNFALPADSNPQVLTSMLEEGPVIERMIRMAATGDVDGANKWVHEDSNILDIATVNFDLSDVFCKFWTPRLSADNLAYFLTTDDYALFYAVTRAKDVKQPLSGIVTSIIRAPHSDLSWKVFWSMLAPASTMRGNTVCEELSKNPYRDHLYGLLDTLHVFDFKFKSVESVPVDLLSLGVFKEGKLLFSRQGGDSKGFKPKKTRARKVSQAPVSDDSNTSSLDDIDADDVILPIENVSPLIPDGLDSKDTDVEVLLAIWYFLNPPSYVRPFPVSMNNRDESQLVDEITKWYYSFLPVLSSLCQFMDTPVTVRGVLLEGLIPLFCKSFMYEMAQRGAFRETPLLKEKFKDEVLLEVLQAVLWGKDKNIRYAYFDVTSESEVMLGRDSLYVIQSVSKKAFGNYIDTAPTDKINVRKSGGVSAWRKKPRKSRSK